MKPIVVAVAITGSVPRKSDNPAVPISSAEQIESTHGAFEAGASLVHIHFRNDDETPSSSPERFALVREGVRKHCPGMIVQFSTGGRRRDPSARGSSLHLRPDMASLSTGSVNFPTVVYENHTSLVGDLATRMQMGGIRPEIEIFDLSHLHAARCLPFRSRPKRARVGPWASSGKWLVGRMRSASSSNSPIPRRTPPQGRGQEGNTAIANRDRGRAPPTTIGQALRAERETDHAA